MKEETKIVFVVVFISLLVGVPAGLVIADEIQDYNSRNYEINGFEIPADQYSDLLTQAPEGIFRICKISDNKCLLFEKMKLEEGG